MLYNAISLSFLLLAMNATLTKSCGEGQMCYDLRTRIFGKPAATAPTAKSNPTQDADGPQRQETPTVTVPGKGEGGKTGNPAKDSLNQQKPPPGGEHTKTVTEPTPVKETINVEKFEEECYKQEDLNAWLDYNPYEPIDGKPQTLTCGLYNVFKARNLMKADPDQGQKIAKLTSKQVIATVEKIRNLYPKSAKEPPAFHRASHALHVLRFLNAMLSNTLTKDFFKTTPSEKFALFFTAAIVDAGHPGFDDKYITDNFKKLPDLHAWAKKKDKEEAIENPNEHHVVMQIDKVFDETDKDNILQSLEPAERTEVTKLMKELISDMVLLYPKPGSDDKDMVHRFMELEQRVFKGITKEISTAGDRKMIMKAMFVLAYHGYLVSEKKVYDAAAAKETEEFTRQEQHAQGNTNAIDPDDLKKHKYNELQRVLNLMTRWNMLLRTKNIASASTLIVNLMANRAAANS